jgi:hypothetical protein
MKQVKLTRKEKDRLNPSGPPTRRCGGCGFTCSSKLALKLHVQECNR